MGWLRQLMGEAEPKIRSFDALAAALIGHPDWPRDSHTQLRSLGALLSKLDRGAELAWLADRVHVQHLAAQVLGCPLSSIQAGLGARLADSDRQRRRFRFDEVRFARPLELVDEALPPGFPSAVQHPGAWQRLWWHAPSGSGRSLLGQWLAARGLARVELVHDGERAATLLDELRDGATLPLFIELLGDGAALGATAPPEHGQYCIASSEVPQHASWQLVRSPKIDSYLKALVAWLAPRLPKDGNFDPEGALEWLQQRVDGSLLDSFGAALGLLGLVDEFGVDNLAKKPLDQVARAFVSEKLKLALSRGSSEAQWLGERGFEVLLGMAERALGTGENFRAVRSESAWLERVPDEFRQGMDQEWARLALSRAVSRSAAKELETALQKLQPGAFRIVRALRSAGLLRSNGAGLGFAPHWLAGVLEAQAFESLFSSSAFHWGEALLAGRHTARIVTALQQRFMNDDFATLEELLELDAAQNPAYAAAIEASFRALGLALGEGTKTAPAELVTALYEEQRELLLQLGPRELPQPRIGYRDSDVVLQPGAFYLAALAISAELPERGVPKQPVLHPWAERVLDTRFDSLLTCIATWLGTLHGEQASSFRRVAVNLVDRLSLHLGEGGGSKGIQAAFVDALGEPHELEWPSLLLRELKAGALNPIWLERLARRPEALLDIHALCAGRLEPWQHVIGQLWELWRAHEMPSGALQAFCAHGERCWPAAPTTCLPDALLRATKLSLTIPFAELSPEQWQHLQGTLSVQIPALLQEPQLWTHAPLPVAWHWLTSKAAEPQLAMALSVVWQRDPTRAIAEYEAALQRDTAGAVATRLIASTPPRHWAMLTPWLKTVTTSKPGAAVVVVDAARRLLHEQVAQRGEGFREAYALLDELERRGRRLGA
jgi:hypothetical protein